MRTATWNNIGTDVSSFKSVEGILTEANLNYVVSKAPITLPNGLTVPNKVATVKDDGSYIGIVSNNYEIYQNKEAFDFIENIPNVTFRKAGETKSGMVYIIGELPSTTVLGDTFTPYVIFQTSHNGMYNVRATICPLRIVCQNQFSLSFKAMTNTIDIRHSRQLPSKVATAQKLLSDTAMYMKGFTNTAEELAMLHIHNESTIYEIVDAFFDSTKQITERQEELLQKKKQFFMDCYNAEDNSNFIGTGWGLLNALSDYSTHRPVKKTKTSSETSFMTVTFDTRSMTKFIDIVKEKTL